MPDDQLVGSISVCSVNLCKKGLVSILTSADEQSKKEKTIWLLSSHIAVGNFAK